LFSCDNSREKQLVSEAFEKYKNSVLNDKGEEAVNYVDNKTLEHYQHILDLVKAADSLELEKSTLLDKFFVIAIRHTTEKEILLKMTGKDLFVHAINKGMVGKESVVNATIGDVEISKDFAVGEFQSGGKNTGVKMHFHKQSNVWKVDLTSLFSFSNIAFEKMIKETGMSENVFLLRVLEEVYEKEADASVWNAIN
jgi:hypothetical protein